MSLRILMRGCGDLGTGVALRLHRVGCQLIIAETSKPLVVRRSVAFANAVFQKVAVVEGVTAVLAEDISEIPELLQADKIPVFVDPDLRHLDEYQADVVVDARMLKQPVDWKIAENPLVIGLGPGFTAGENCHVVIETQRGPFLGRAYWIGTAEPDNGMPEKVGQFQNQRVLRAPADGLFWGSAQIGDFLDIRQKIGNVNGISVHAPFSGLLRGLIANGSEVYEGMKIGDIDPRNDPKLIQFASDKAMSIAGGALEAILSVERYRKQLGEDA